MTKQELWKEILEFYQELVTKYKWSQEPMIELIKYFNQIGLCNKFYPSTSHEALGLSPVDNYEERLYHPMVYITYQSKTNTFKLAFQTGQGKNSREEVFGQIIDTLAIAKIEQWLSNTE